MQRKDISHLAKLPKELWELVFDHVGLDLSDIQLTCGFFRHLSAKRLWSDVYINFTDELPVTEPYTTLVTRWTIGSALEIFSLASAHFKRVTIDLREFDLQEDEIPQSLSAVRLAMKSATEMLLIVDSYPLSTDCIKLDLVEAKLAVRIIDSVYSDADADRLEKAVEFYEAFSAAIEIDISLNCSLILNERVSKHVKWLRIDFAPLNQVKELVQKCPRVEFLYTGISTTGRFVLPNCVKGVELDLTGLVTDEFDKDLLVVSSNFITRLTLDPVRLNCCVRVEFPSLKVLELRDMLYFKKHQAKILKLFAKNLDQFIVETAGSGCLARMAQCVSAKEIILKDFGLAIELSHQEKRQYILDHFDFMATNRDVRRVHLELPIFDPERMEALIDLLLQVCPLIESLSIGDVYKNSRRGRIALIKEYPYMRNPIRQLCDSSQDDGIEIDVQKIRSSGSRLRYDNINELLDGI